jgi:hypothetical protein
VGRSAPDFELADGTKLGDRLRSGRGVLLDFDVRAPLQPLAVRWGGRVGYVAASAKETLGLAAVLVRPDGVAAWLAESAPDPDQAAAALSQWFGRPG